MSLRKQQVAAAALLFIFITGVNFGCTYVWQREFRTEGEAANPHVRGWTLSARIVGLEQRSMRKEVSVPTRFAISFRAVRLRSTAASGSEPDVEDISLDSAVVLYRPGDLRENWVLNSGGWVSYESISPRELVKAFSESGEDSSAVKWHTIPPEIDQLKVTLYARANVGRLAQRPRDGATIPIDTIIVNPDVIQSALEPIEMTLTARNRHLQIPGVMSR